MGQQLLDYVAGAPVAPAPPTGGGPVTPGPYGQPLNYSAGNTTGPVGTAPLTGTHNTSLHVAAWGIGALALIVLMHQWGFHLVSVGKFGGR